MNVDSALYSSMIGFNMYAYCENNPINYVDPNGESGIAAALGTWAASAWWLVAADGPIPVGDIIYAGGIAILGGIAVVETLFLADTVVDIIQDSTLSIDLDPPSSIIEKNKSETDKDSNPYKRPGQKKQGRENRERKRVKNSWESRNNRRDGLPRKPKKHTPGRDHKKHFIAMPNRILVFEGGD